jgi:transporter family-2 protein
MFAFALLLAVGVTLPLHGSPTVAQLSNANAPFISYAGGVLICFYALSATIVIPRFGAASFIAFVLIAQLLTSALVDQFGLFGMAKRPGDALRLAGLMTIALGIAIMQAGNLRKP